MKKITMFLAVALTCTTFAFAAEESAPQNELHMQAPQIAGAVEETVSMDENATVALPEAPAQTEEPATPSDMPVDEEMLVTPEAPAVETPAEEAPEVEAPIVETPTEEAPEVEAPIVEVPTEEAPEVEAPIVEVPTEEAPEVEAPIVETPAEEAPIVEVPAEEVPVVEEPILVEIPEIEIPVAAAPVTITVRGAVYDNDMIIYQEEQTIETTVGETLDLNAYVWSETPGIALNCSAEIVTVSAETTEYVLTYDLLEGWVIL